MRSFLFEYALTDNVYEIIIYFVSETFGSEINVNEIYFKVEIKCTQ